MPAVVPAGLREAVEAYYAAIAQATAAELAGAGGAGFYLRRAALESAIARRMATCAAVSVHRGLLAGATLAQVADATGVTVAEAAVSWRAWAEPQRRLEREVPGLGLSDQDYRRAAAVIEASMAGAGILSRECGCAGKARE